MESGLSITYGALLAEVSGFLGYGPTRPAAGSSELAECDRHVQSGLRKFYYPPAVSGIAAGYEWSFLNPTATIATVADDAAQDLPSDLYRVKGSFHYAQSEHKARIVQVTEERYKILLSRSEDTGRPRYARIRRKPQGETGQRQEVAWWPIPDGAYTLSYQYEGFAGPLSDDSPYPLGGMLHSELLIESCLSVAEQRANDEIGTHTALFERALVAAIEHDRTVGPNHFGPMGDYERETKIPRHGDTGGSYPITYNGVAI